LVLGEKRDTMSNTGCVNFFNPTKGFGFITADAGGQDLFVHFSSIQSDGFKTLDNGETCRFDIGSDNDGRMVAVNVTGNGDGEPRMKGKGGGKGKGGKGGKPGGYDGGKGFGEKGGYDGGKYGGYDGGGGGKYGGGDFWKGGGGDFWKGGGGGWGQGQWY
jgi:cold shock CspA family protein